MKSQHSTLLAVAAVCALLSVVTTIGIHGFITGPATFEESLVMYKTPYYIFTKWWVILHCLFVVVSIYGICTYTSHSAFSRLGLLFYTAFGLTEVFRMLLVLHYLNVLRDRFLAADSHIQEIIRLDLDAFAGISQTMFVGFTLFILLGNLFTGIAALSGVGIMRFVGYALLIWACVLMLSLINIYMGNSALDSVIHYFSLSIQPAVRLLIAFALYKAYRNIHSPEWNPITTQQTVHS